MVNSILSSNSDRTSFGAFRRKFQIAPPARPWSWRIASCFGMRPAGRRAPENSGKENQKGSRNEDAGISRLSRPGAAAPRCRLRRPCSPDDAYRFRAGRPAAWRDGCKDGHLKQRTDRLGHRRVIERKRWQAVSNSRRWPRRCGCLSRLNARWVRGCITGCRLDRSSVAAKKLVAIFLGLRPTL
jgi:hypothetical protein